MPLSSFNPIPISGSAYDNEAEVIRRNRERQDETFKPLLSELVNRYQNQADYGEAFVGAQSLVDNNTARQAQQLQQRNQRFGVQQTRAEFDQSQKDLEYQRGLSSATVATDTAQELIKRQDELLTGGRT